MTSPTRESILEDLLTAVSRILGVGEGENLLDVATAVKRRADANEAASGGIDGRGRLAQDGPPDIY